MFTAMDKYAVRQFFILTTGCLTSIGSGLVMSFPSVLNPSITSPNSTFHATSSETSWIAASNGISGIIGFFILSPLFQMIGRKYVNFILSTVQLIGWIIFVFAESIFDLYVARLMQGFGIAGFFIISVTIAEYCDPKRRGYFMCIKKVAMALGSLACHALALFTNWRQISIFCCVPLILSAIMTLYWPESPAFLAMKGRFDECKKSFYWTNGNSPHSEQQLEELIYAQSRRLIRKNNSITKLSLPVKLMKKFGRKDFLKPLFISCTLALAIDACGRFFLLTYITQIIVDITGDTSFAMYCAVASDLLLICALSTSCFLIKIFERRTILLTFGSFAAGLMFLISLGLVLKIHFNIATDVRWIVPSIILLHGFVSHVGLIPIAFAIMSEVFPLEHKGLGCFASGVIITIFYTLTIKLTPLMIEYMGVMGTYATYGVCVSICLISLYYTLPETKDKTLQKIEDNIKGLNRTHEDDVLVNSFDDLNKYKKHGEIE